MIEADYGQTMVRMKYTTLLTGLVNWLSCSRSQMYSLAEEEKELLYCRNMYKDVLVKVVK